MAKIDIVIPFYNRFDLLGPCLRSLAIAAGDDTRVILVDDASKPGESALARSALKQLPMPTTWLNHGINRGFVAAILSGVAVTEAPYIVLLNSDTIVTPGFAQMLVEVMESESNVKAVAPVSNASSDLFQFREYAQIATTEMPDLLREIPKTCIRVRKEAVQKSIRTAYLTGACLALDRAAFIHTGLLSQEYEHGYFEDLDLCCRLRGQGFALAIREDCFVYHRGQGSYRMMEDSARGRIMQANFALYCKKWGHLPEHGALMQRLAAAAQQP